ncbi:hypothetical protein ACFWUU_00270 [Kribbella sp. NPDC058693]
MGTGLQLAGGLTGGLLAGLLGRLLDLLLGMGLQWVGGLRRVGGLLGG